MPAAIRAAFFRVEDLALSIEVNAEVNFEKIRGICVVKPDYSVSSKGRSDRAVGEVSRYSFGTIVSPSPANSLWLALARLFLGERIHQIIRISSDPKVRAIPTNEKESDLTSNVAL